VLFAAYPNLAGAVGKNITLLATNGAQRAAIAPNVPPVADVIPGFDFAPVVGIYARAGTPPTFMQKIADEVAVIVKEPEVIKQLGATGIEAAPAGPKEFGDALKRENDRVAKVVEVSGMKPR
jgi:tripartite-type tricarboxylate transporter receptor subunit TctC